MQHVKNIFRKLPILSYIMILREAELVRGRIMSLDSALIPNGQDVDSEANAAAPEENEKKDLLPPVAKALAGLDRLETPVQVALSQELVVLLSEQLYQSPIKAIEELVVNSFDADASECRIYVPNDSTHEFMAIFDNGSGMDEAGLGNLWHIGHSTKRDDEERRALQGKRKVIGRFGIGKLATYTIARHLTYISRHKDSMGQDKILSVTVDFDRFKPSPLGQPPTINIDVREVADLEDFARNPLISSLFEVLDIAVPNLISATYPSWTIALLENLKPKAKRITGSQLKWSLSKALPYRIDGFKIFLNKEEVESSKEDHIKLIEFEIQNMSKLQLDKLKSKEAGEWESKTVNGRPCLACSLFPNGVTGNVIVTLGTLKGKSDDLGRSNGFFVRVRGRLINSSDDLFGLSALEHATFSRFRADIVADDLDPDILASRDTLEEQTDRIEIFRKLLRFVFNEADNLYDKYRKTLDEPSSRVKEGELNHVSQRYVEHALADAIALTAEDSDDATASVMKYVELPKEDVASIVKTLYGSRPKYSYDYVNSGKLEPLARLNISTATFQMNKDHELVQEYSRSPEARRLLEDLATAEVLLEAYLRSSQLEPNAVTSILQRRDYLLRGLAHDHAFSPRLVATALRDARSNPVKLEIALIVAVRTVGFIVERIAGTGDTEGIAEYAEYEERSGGTRRITLEAKSSINRQQSAKDLNFSAVRTHMDRHNAKGCLMVAPRYPGEDDEDSNVVSAAKTLQLSCWTIDQLADFVEGIETHRLGAKQLYEIVTTKFSPIEVTNALDEIFETTPSNPADLYNAILWSLRQLENRLQQKPRDLGMIQAILSQRDNFANIDEETLRRSFIVMEHQSGGALILHNDGTVTLNGSVDHLASLIMNLTNDASSSRSISNFRK